MNRDVLCQLPPEAGHPPYNAARLEKPAYGMNDALDGGGISLTKHCAVLVWFLQELTDAVTYYQGNYERERTLNQGNYSQCDNTKNIPIKPSDRIEADDAYDRMLDPIASSPATRKTMAWIINLFVDDLFGTSGTEMEQRALPRLRKDFQVGSEDWNDVTFTRQRIRWINDSQPGSYIEVIQQKAIDELKEIPVERNTKEDLNCTPAMHTMYRSLLGQMNRLQSWTQFQCCCNSPDVLQGKHHQQLVM